MNLLLNPDDAADGAPEPLSTAPEPPEEWSDSARVTWTEVTEERRDLSAAELAALAHACALETAADALDAVAREAGYVAVGSTGQPVAHPATVESRLARSAAATILSRLVPPAKGGAMTNSQRGQAAARARWGGGR
jgi:hypothetical protein